MVRKDGYQCRMSKAYLSFSLRPWLVNLYNNFVTQHISTKLFPHFRVCVKNSPGWGFYIQWSPIWTANYKQALEQRSQKLRLQSRQVCYVALVLQTRACEAYTLCVQSNYRPVCNIYSEFTTNIISTVAFLSRTVQNIATTIYISTLSTSTKLTNINNIICTYSTVRHRGRPQPTETEGQNSIHRQLYPCCHVNDHSSGRTVRVQ